MRGNPCDKCRGHGCGECRRKRVCPGCSVPREEALEYRPGLRKVLAPDGFVPLVCKHCGRAERLMAVPSPKPKAKGARKP